jgi:hypothetical protein
MHVSSDVPLTHCSFLQINTLIPAELGPIIRYPRPKELADDKEEEPSPSQEKKRRISPAVEEVGSAHEEREGEMADEPTAVTR